MNFTQWLSSVPPKLPVTRSGTWKFIASLSLLAKSHGRMSANWCKTAACWRSLISSTALWAVSAPIFAEGYNKASQKTKRVISSILGSAREARDWYYKTRHILGEEVFIHRARLLVQIIRPLLKIVPEFRGKKISEEQAEYEAYTLEMLLENVPFGE